MSLRGQIPFKSRMEPDPYARSGELANYGTKSHTPREMLQATMPSVLDLFSLKDRTALVTGATRGIGQSLALALAEAGADIVLIQRDESSQATKQAIEHLGRKATIYVADLASATDVAGLTKRVLAEGHDIDILVNCAGIQRRHPAHQFPDSDWNEVWSCN